MVYLQYISAQNKLFNSVSFCLTYTSMFEGKGELTLLTNSKSILKFKPIFTFYVYIALLITLIWIALLLRSQKQDWQMAFEYDTQPRIHVFFWNFHLVHFSIFAVMICSSDHCFVYWEKTVQPDSTASVLWKKCNIHVCEREFDICHWNVVFI